MRAWLWLSAVIVCTAAPVVAMRAIPTPGATADRVDEVLAYELTAARPLRLKIPAGTASVQVSSWLVLEDETHPDSAHPYEYTLAASLTAEGFTTNPRRYRVESRVTPRTTTYNGMSRSSTWVAGSPAWVTDARLTELETKPIAGRGGILVLQADGPSCLLVRATIRVPRPELDQRLLPVRMTPETAAKLFSGRSSVGFFDLDEGARAAAAGTRPRRIEAEGRTPVDFAVRRLMIGPSGAPTVTPTPAAIRPIADQNHAIAINVNRASHLYLTAQGGARVRWTEGMRAAAILEVRDANPVELALHPEDGPRTIVVDREAGEDAQVRLFLPPGEPDDALVGEPRRSVVENGLQEILPEIQPTRYFALSQEAPVLARIAPGQELLGLYVRAAAKGEDPLATTTGRIEACWAEISGRACTSTEVSLARSRFERWRSGRDATDAQTAVLRVPSHVEQVELRGDADLLVSLFTRELEVGQDELSPGYRVELGPEDTLRFARYDERRRTPVRPANALELVDAGRSDELIAQARIEKLLPQLMPQSALAPVGAHSERHLAERRWYVPGVSFPEDALTPIDKPVRVLIASSGPHARQLVATYFVAPAMLGNQVGLRVDGAEVATQTAVTQGGKFELPITAGAHLVQVTGLGRGGMAYADTAPAQAMLVLRRRLVFRLMAGESFDFRFPQKEAEPLYFVLLAASTTRGVMPPLTYEMKTLATLRFGEFCRYTSETSGPIPLREQPASSLFFEEALGLAGQAQAVSLAKGTILVGDDAHAGARIVRVRNPASGRPVWIRAVLAGRASSAPSADPSLSIHGEI